MDYFTPIPSKLGVDLCIFWNTAEICGENQDGYIVQHMRIKNPFDFIENLKAYTEYFEAWPVKGGQVVRAPDAQNLCDDTWSPIPEIRLILDSIQNRILAAQDACVTYDASVYWIPAGTEEWNDIQSWQAIPDLPSLNLQAAHVYQKDLSPYHICDRHYTWDYKQIVQRLAER